MRKINWLKKLYRDAKNAEILAENPTANDQQVDQLYENPFEDQRFADLNDTEFEQEVNNLIEWCEDLDYEKYINNWNKLATSAYAGVTQNYEDYVKAGQQSNVFSPIEGEMGATELGEEGGFSSEEAFLRQNMDYEAKLKEHLY